MYICSKSKIQQMHETRATLEILIATMNRSNLDFLNAMFPYDFEHLNLIIVNQTTAENTITSAPKHIKVINSFEKGLSRSRNLALEKATASICLFSDDDVIFLAGFENTIKKAFVENPSEITITFQTLTTEKKLFWHYPKQNETHTKLVKILSHEIAIRREEIIKKNIRFNAHFGLGATFEDSENYIFLKEIQKQIAMPFFYKKSIAMHQAVTSSDEIASDRHIFARAALLYKYKKNIAYIYILKLIFFLLRTKRISINDIPKKWHVAMQGIKKYKELNNA
jgi:glycosyltransferase involved in cell wall biosynthesis